MEMLIPEKNQKHPSRFGDILNTAQAYWLTRDTIAWPIELPKDAVFTLHEDQEGRITLDAGSLHGGEKIPLIFAGVLSPRVLFPKFPHIQKSVILKIPKRYLKKIPEILKGQAVVSAVKLDGSLLKGASLQTPGVLDDLYANDASLGVTWNKDIPTLRIWAPTAQVVRLLLFKDSTSPEHQVCSMTWDSETGNWSVVGESGWKNQYYLYELEVFVRSEGRVVRNQVTDPYSLSLSTNSKRSQIVDLSDPDLIPKGWDSLPKPPLQSFTDIVIYELHVRDFSVRDQTIPAQLRGTFLAFAQTESDGMNHLKRLAGAGITHVHLLPVFDIATIDEDKSRWQKVDFDKLSEFPPDSDQQQAAIQNLRSTSGYNWGYDPFHYSAPEGSYSTNPDGFARIIEFRQMIQALNQAGLRVIMDVVYNHTNASGQHEKSVLDRIVPGYYHRLDENGQVIQSTCCENTATEHAMMRKLMVDSVLTWAKAYKVDGFRFDLMGHHMKADMVALRVAVDSLTFEADGVEGRMIYTYGEGWELGEMENNARGINAVQFNMTGTRTGTFNDRLRDAVRGGTPFLGHQLQGYATGLYTNPNEINLNSKKSQRVALLAQKDLIRAALAGNLAEYKFENAVGAIVSGKEVDYNGKPAGYTASPEEHIAYISAHDNETLFDAIQYKVPLTASIKDRVLIQNLALSLVAFCQGIPFFHAGCEILRSKSFDRDSFDSTDWFNAIDWAYNDNNWGHGLPLKDKNGAMWPVIRKLLGRPDLAPDHKYLQMSLSMFESLIKIRRSSPLFRLQTAEQIQQSVRFHNTGPDQIPGLISMSLHDEFGIDPCYASLFVLFNADPKPIQFTLLGLNLDGLRLHPDQIIDFYYSPTDFDSTSQTFKLPGWVTVVFVKDKPAHPASEKN